MSIMEKLLQDSLLTEAGILQDLQTMGVYFDEMQISSKLVPVTESTPLPSLIAVLEADEKQRPRLLNQSFLPLDKDDAEFTKYLQFYLELQDDLAAIDRMTLLEALCRLNTMLPLGACTLIAPRPQLELPELVGMRMVQGFPDDNPVDQGVFTEDVFLFDLSCTIVSTVLDGLAAGKSLDEAFAVLGE